jgi:hypothetical protein
VARCAGDGRPRPETVVASLAPLLEDVMAAITGAEIAVGLPACRNRPLGA